MSDPSISARRRTRLAVLAALALLLFSLFTALGTWQVFRLQWKRALIERVESRVHAPPVDLPPPAAWPAVNEGADEYRHVRAQGQWLNQHAVRVQALSDLGSGYWLMVPLQLAGGHVVLVNRGFISPALKLPVPAPSGSQTVTGLLRMSQPGGGFLRENDAAAGRWYSRDVQAIAASQGLNGAAPFFIDADAQPGQNDPALGPVGGLTVIRFNNHHLQYALTWFALAAMVLVAYVVVLRHERRR